MKNRTEIFEHLSVPKAVFALAIPTILSQLVNIVYNLTDTFFIGLLKDPYQTAAVNLSYPLFFMFIVLANLFGMGGGSLISRLLGKKDHRQIKHVSALSFFFSIGVTFIYTMIVLIFLEPLLTLMGASANTMPYSKDYTMWAVVVGGVPTVLTMTMGHLLRSEGLAKQASIGFVIGAVANIIFDPLFMFGLGMETKGAAIATMLANVIALMYYIYITSTLKDKIHLSLKPKNFRLYRVWIYAILAIGIPSATASLLNLIATVFVNNLTVAYGDIPLAAMGIVKKIDMIPFAISIGITQGIIPLIGYNFAAKKYKRMRAFSHFGMAIILGFSALCVVAFNIFPETIFKVFMKETQTLSYGAPFLKIAVLATPVMGINLLINSSFQAMGKGKESMVLSLSRQGLINIPLLFLMNHLFGLYGIIWTQFVADFITLVISYILYSITVKKLHLNDNKFQYS